MLPGVLCLSALLDDSWLSVASPLPSLSFSGSGFAGAPHFWPLGMHPIGRLGRTCWVPCRSRRATVGLFHAARSPVWEFLGSCTLQQVSILLHRMVSPFQGSRFRDVSSCCPPVPHAVQPSLADHFDWTLNPSGLRPHFPPVLLLSSHARLLPHCSPRATRSHLPAVHPCRRPLPPRSPLPLSRIPKTSPCPFGLTRAASDGRHPRDQSTTHSVNPLKKHEGVTPGQPLWFIFVTMLLYSASDVNLPSPSASELKGPE